MKTQISRWFFLPILAAFSLACALAQSLIVSTPPPAAPVVANQYNLTLGNSLDNAGAVNLMAPPPSVTPQQILPQMSGNPNVQTAEPNATMIATETSSGSQAVSNLVAVEAALLDSAMVDYYGTQVRAAYVDQPAVSLIELPRAQKHFPTGAPIVAVIDTGVDPNHPALANVLLGGYDFTRNQQGIPNEMNDLSLAAYNALTNSSAVPQSWKTFSYQPAQSTVVILDQSTVVILDGAGALPGDFGHGTMVAGLIHLAAPTAMIMPLKAFTSTGAANLSDIVRAIYYATNNGASVISMSFDTTTPSPSLQAAIAYATSNGVICVASSGNEGQQLLTYPAGFPQVIGVGSTSATNSRSVFSDYGVPSVDMAAPGEALITTYPGGNYAAVWGTSFSTALVSGTAAIMQQMDQSLPYSGTLFFLDSGYPLPYNLGLGPSRLDMYQSLKDLMHHGWGNGQGGN